MGFVRRELAVVNHHCQIVKSNACNQSASRIVAKLQVEVFNQTTMIIVKKHIHPDERKNDFFAVIPYLDKYLDKIDDARKKQLFFDNI